MICSCCPRKCNKPRGSGFCRIPEGVFVSKFMLHKWEEPVFTGATGTAAVFFSGCNLRCCYCQNADISRDVTGEKISRDEFVEKIVAMVKAGAKSVDLVSPTPFVPFLTDYLAELKKHVDVPVIYNSGGYDLPEYIDIIGRYIDVFLPDFKYINSETAKKYSAAPDYPEAAEKAIAEMLKLRPRVQTNGEGLMTKGVVIRHLVLPGHRDESMKIIDYAAEHFGGALMSIMSQYTPEFNRSPYKNLSRRVTAFEYESVLNYAAEKGIKGFSQLRSSADKKYTPDF